MKKKYQLIFLISMLFFSCKKESNEAAITDEIATTSASISLKDAEAYLSSFPLDSIRILKSLKLNWQFAEDRTGTTGNTWSIPLSGQPTFQGYHQGYRELNIYRNTKTRKIEASIMEVIPDVIYLQQNGRSNTETFTGRVFRYDLSYNLQGGRLFYNGKPIGEIKQLSSQEQLNLANDKLSQANPSIGIQGKLMRAAIIETCTWARSDYIDANGELNIHSERICNITIIDDGGGGGTYTGVGGGSSGSNGGGGGSSTSSPPPPSNLPGEQNEKVDPKKMMACFSLITDPNAAFVVRVYVVEPLPGTSFNVGQNSFGHVAISLSKTSGNTTITQTIGYYPTGSGLNKLDSKSQLLDNGDIKYDVSATYYVNGGRFQRVINYISDPPKQYHFTDFNCAAFVYGAGQAGNIPIPDPTTQIGISGPGGAGFAKTPAGMAGALRQQKSNNPNSDINEGGGRVPGSNGPCN